MSTPATYAFDQRNIRWFPLGDFKHLQISMLAVDPDARIVDFIVKFDARQRIFLHRHLAQTNLFVVQGEHRIYEPDGSLQEIRKTGSYTASAPGGVHFEGGGDEDTIVLYNIRGNGNDEMFEVMDDDGTVVGIIGVADFAAVLAEQRKA
ncbi:MAG: regulator [Gammaproteobacteria bacterium]